MTNIINYITMKNLKNKQKGFTLIEILVVIGLIAILAAIVIIAINPARQFAQGRNSQRQSNVNSILNAIGQRIADNKGTFNGTLNGVICPSIPAGPSTISASGLDLYTNCLVPTYISSELVDPSNGSTVAPYNSQYTVAQDALTQRITVCAPKANEPNTTVQQDICVTR